MIGDGEKGLEGAQDGGVLRRQIAVGILDQDAGSERSI